MDKKSALEEQVLQLISDAETSVAPLISIAKQNYDLYNGLTPAPYFDGDSEYVDRIIQNHVDGTICQIEPIFTSQQKQVVRFRPLSSQDVLEAKAMSAWVSKKVLADNQGNKKLMSSVKESLICRISWMKTHWVDEEVADTLKFDMVSKEDLDKIKEQYKECYYRKYKDAQTNQEFYRGHVISYRTDSDCRITNIPLDNMIFPADCQGEDFLDIVGEKVVMDTVTLKEMFGKKTIEDLGSSDDLDEGISSLGSLDSFTNQTEFNWENNSSVDSENKYHLLKEVYVRTSVLTKGKGLQWVQCFVINDTLVEYNVVSEHPYNAIVALPIPNRLVGDSFPDRLKNIQDQRTKLQRSIATNTLNIAYPRYRAVRDSVDEESLMNNVEGGVVWIEANKPLDSVGVFNETPLSSDVYNLLAVLEQEASQITGISNANQGLDPNVLKGNNAAATVMATLNAGTKRIASYAKCIAYGWKGVLSKYYEYLKDNFHNEDYVYCDGREYVVKGNNLKNREYMIDPIVGEEANIAQAQSLMLVMDRIQANEALVKGYNPYQAMMTLMETLDIPDRHLILTDPSQIQPSQTEVYTQQVQQQMLDINLQKAVLELEDSRSLIEERQARIVLDSNKLALDQMRLVGEQEKMAEDVETDRTKLQIEAHKVGLEESKLIQDGEIAAAKLDMEQVTFQHNAAKDLAASMLVDTEVALETQQQRPVKLG